MKEIYFKINIKYICLFGIGILLIPNIIFCSGWLRNPFGMLGIIVLIFSFVRLCVERELINKKLFFSLRALLLLIVLCFVIVWLAGIGGYFPQLIDNYIRNPMFHDIIFKEWPIVYEEINGALTYYYAFWLFPALIGKFAIMAGIETVWVEAIANVALMIQSALYLLIIFILGLSYIKKDGEKVCTRNVLKCCVTFIIFGGISICGYKVAQSLGVAAPREIDGLGIEHFVEPVGFLNNWLVMLANVYNQMLPGLLCTALFLSMKSIKTMGYLLGLILLSAPYPAVGIFIIMASWFLKELISTKKLYLKELFSIYNIISLGCLILAWLFYRGNLKAGITPSLFWEKYETLGMAILAYCIYHIFTWGIYYLALFKTSCEKFLLGVSAGCFLLFVFGNFDFNCRGIIAPMFILFLESYCYLEKKAKDTRGGVFLTIILTFASVTPIVVWGNLFEQALENGTLKVRQNKYYTLSNLMQSDEVIMPQYVKYSPEDDFFYSKLCKRWDRDEEYPIVEYRISETGVRYIEQVAVFSTNALEKLFDDVAEESLGLLRKAVVNFPEKTNFEFDEEQILCKNQELLSTEKNKVDIVWENPCKRISYDQTVWLLDLKVTNIGEQNILVGAGENEAYKSGVVCTIYDENKEPLFSPWGVAYTNKTIFAGDSKERVITIDKPERGKYYIGFDYFCDDINGKTSYRGYSEEKLYPIEIY